LILIKVKPFTVDLAKTFDAGFKSGELLNKYKTEMLLNLKTCD